MTTKFSLTHTMFFKKFYTQIYALQHKEQMGYISGAQQHCYLLFIISLTWTTVDLNITTKYFLNINLMRLLDKACEPE